MSKNKTLFLLWILVIAILVLVIIYKQNIVKSQEMELKKAELSIEQKEERESSGKEYSIKKEMEKIKEKSDSKAAQWAEIGEGEE